MSDVVKDWTSVVESVIQLEVGDVVEVGYDRVRCALLKSGLVLYGHDLEAREMVPRFSSHFVRQFMVTSLLLAVLVLLGSACANTKPVDQGVALKLNVSADTDVVAPEGTLVYTITYANIGTEPATGVYVFEHYDRVTFAASEPPPMPPSKNIWDIGTVSSGMIGTIAITVAVDPWLADGSVLLNLVQLDSAETPPLSEVEMTSVSVRRLLCPCPLEPNNTMTEAVSLDLDFYPQVSAYPEDEHDFYYFTLDTPKTIVVNVANYTAIGQLRLYYNPEGESLILKDRDVSEIKGMSWLGVTLKKEAAEIGKYYIDINTLDAPNKRQLYNLKITEVSETSGD